MAIREKIRRKIRAHKATPANHRHRSASIKRRKPVMIDLKKARAHDGHRKSGSIVSYSKSLRFLSTLSDYERLRIVRYNHDNFNLERMRNLLRKLGNPQEHFRSVHVAGTKGKGSTCAMIAAMLQANGYKVGLYTSPHLVDVRERIVIDGEMIPQASFARLVRLIENMIGRLKPTPTYFDVLTAIAFKYFADNKVDIAVIETGLGGRLDSTNVIRPEVTAITSISHDHMAQLGPTLGHIATEKAGIFKHNIPAVSVIQDPQAEAALKKIAEKVGAPLDFTGQTIEFSYRFESSRMLGPHNRVADLELVHYHLCHGACSAPGSVLPREAAGGSSQRPAGATALRTTACAARAASL